MVVPLVIGLLLAPLVILMHECGHYTADVVLGLHPILHATSVQGTVLPPGGLSTGASLVFMAAGPLVELLCTVGGFVWLMVRRRYRLDVPPTTLDWLATSLACFCCRWIHHTPDLLWKASRTGHYGGDEAAISRLLGLPAWVLPVAIWFPCLWLLVTTIRMHPQGQRLFPFTALFLGMGLGTLLWLEVLGPTILDGPSNQQPTPITMTSDRVAEAKRLPSLFPNPVLARKPSLQNRIWKKGRQGLEAAFTQDRRPCPRLMCCCPFLSAGADVVCPPGCSNQAMRLIPFPRNRSMSDPPRPTS